MPTLPTALDFGERPTPRPQASAPSFTAGKQGEALAEFGKSAIGLSTSVASLEEKRKEDERKKDVAIETAYAKANLLQKQIDLESSLSRRTDYDKIGSSFDEEIKTHLDASSSLISDPKAREAFVAEAQDNIVRGRARMSEAAFKSAGDAASTNLQTYYDKMIARPDAVSEELAVAQQDAFAQMVDASRERGYIGFSKAYEVKKQAAQGLAESVFSKLPAQERLELLTKDQQKISAQEIKETSFDSIVNNIIDNHEGEKLVTDSNGYKAIYGINEKYNPDLFEGGRIPTRDEAVQAYKARYWEANKIGDLPPEMRLAAMDAVIQHGAGPKMIAQADGDPSRLIALRRDYYRSLPDYDKNGKGWDKRLDAITEQTAALRQPTSLVSMLSPQSRAKAMEAAQDDLRKVQIDTLSRTALDASTQSGSLSDGIRMLKDQAGVATYDDALSKLTQMWNAQQGAVREDRLAAEDEVNNLIAGGKSFADVPLSLRDRLSGEQKIKFMNATGSTDWATYNAVVADLSGGKQVDLREYRTALAGKYEDVVKFAAESKTLAPMDDYIQQGQTMAGIRLDRIKKDDGEASKAALFSDRFIEEVRAYKASSGGKAPDDKAMRSIRDKLVRSGLVYSGGGATTMRRYETPYGKPFVAQINDSAVFKAVTAYMDANKAELYATRPTLFTPDGKPSKQGVLETYTELTEKGGWDDLSLVGKYGQ